ncbi:MAG: GxxExxY protein [Bacteroidales bacterium]|nr:GxxExxY protein [Bacteroidales bacterium]
MNDSTFPGANFSLPTPFIESVAKTIIDCTFKVHKQLGPGLLEKVYEVALCYELEKAGIDFERQVAMPIYYDEIRFDEGYRVDILVEDLIICELKSVTEIHPVHRAQLLSYMKLSNKELGFLINFNVPLIKQGIKRYRL